MLFALILRKWGFAIQPIQEILTEDHRRAKIGPIRQ